MIRPDAPFLAAIIADPADDALRLIYADWLDENGEPERAEFIRVQIANPTIKIAATPWVKHGAQYSHYWAFDHCKCPAMRRKGMARAVCVSLPDPNKWEDNSNHPTIYFRRGFVDSIRCTAADCIVHLDAIREGHPVSEAWLTKMELDESGYKLLFTRAAEKTGLMDKDYEAGQLVVHCMRHVWPGITFHLPPLRQSGREFNLAADGEYFESVTQTTSV